MTFFDVSQGNAIFIESPDGRQVLVDGARLEILHPGSEPYLEERNENSVSLRLVYGDFAALFTGDAEEGAERMMLESGRPLQ